VPAPIRRPARRRRDTLPTDGESETPPVARTADLAGAELVLADGDVQLETVEISVNTHLYALVTCSQIVLTESCLSETTMSRPVPQSNVGGCSVTQGGASPAASDI
jgi:hypothetical protein